MENNIIKIDLELDLNPINKTIEEATTLEGSILFESLSQFAQLKKLFNDAKDLLDAAETQVKYAINDRAKALYGTDWTAIKGNNYKITRSKTGNVYEITDEKKAHDFVKIEVKPDTDKIGTYQLEHNELPDGVALNPERGESIRITVK